MEEPPRPSPPKYLVPVAAGAAATAAVVGISLAVMQSKSPPASEPSQTVVVSPAPSPTATQSPTQSPVLQVPANTNASPTTPAAQPTPASQPSPSNQTPNTTATTPPQTETSATVSAPEVCVVRMARVSDPNPPLNVRSAPNADSGSNVLGSLKNGTLVTVAQEQNGWFQITTPLKGWISKQQTENGCNQKVARIEFGTNGTTATVSDRFIGTGNHKYLLNATKGQTITLTSRRGPLPAILTPDGKTLVGLGDKEATWSGQLPVTGDYSLELDSNYKGYKYAFLVSVK